MNAIAASATAFNTARTELTPLSPALLKRSAQFMAKYIDIPMDFDYASLVALAEERGITEILILDRKVFQAYRTASRKGFIIMPK